MPAPPRPPGLLIATLLAVSLGTLPGLASWVAGACPDDGPADPDPARYADELDAFAREDRESPPAPGGVLFIGSSSVSRWDLDASFPGLGATNRGLGGAHLSDVIALADRLIAPHRPRQIVLYAGDNDIAGGKSAERVRDDFRRLAEICRTLAPEAPLAFLSIKPSPSRERFWPEASRANAMIEALAQEDDQLEFVDVSAPLLGPGGAMRPELYVGDRLHLNDRGYAIWAGVLRPVVGGPDAVTTDGPSR